MAGRGLGSTCNGEPLRVAPVDRLDRALVVRQTQTSDPGEIAQFAQGPLVRRVHPSAQWAKLESLVAGARLAGQRL